MPAAAKMGDQVLGTDVHIELVPSPGGPVPTPFPLPFSGTITGGCSQNVLVENRPAAVVGSTATNSPPHLPMPPGTAFQVPPTNSGTVVAGSATVLINNKPAARAGDSVMTCADPVPTPNSKIQGVSTVLIGP